MKRRVQPPGRLPFFVGAHPAGSVAREHAAALCEWPRWLELHADRITLTAAADAREAAFATINAALRESGLIRAWRNEFFVVVDEVTGEALTRFERAAARFWGTLSFGAHANGVVRGADGHVQWMWIAQRAFDKATDPGLFDNLVGAGVPCGQTPRQALERECWEEAGIDGRSNPRQRAWLDAMAPASVLELDRAIPEGWQHEHLHAFDLWLPEDFEPRNIDGEVAGFTRMAPSEAIALAASGRMTVDATLVVADFALRHGLPLPEALRGAVLAARYSSP
jgi:8-oxo-dGTP pyrophosphatase MutT (NUDIX family)